RVVGLYRFEGLDDLGEHLALVGWASSPVEHPVERMPRDQQAAADAESRQLAVAGRAVSGVTAEAEDAAGLLDRERLPLRGEPCGVVVFIAADGRDAKAPSN